MSPLSSSSGEDDEYFQYNYSHSAKTKRKTKPSLFLAMCRTYIVTFVTAGFLKLINDLLNFVGPQVLKLDFSYFCSGPIIFNHLYRLLIEYTKNPDDPAWKGYFYACVLFASAITQSLVLQHYFHRCFVFGMHLKSAIISVVYNKVCYHYICLSVYPFVWFSIMV